MIPYGKQDISEDDINAVVEVLRSSNLTQGPLVPRFENLVMEYCGAKYSIATNSATSALHIACLALGVKEGDVVWTSPNTFVASANCALYCGAKVDFVDIDPKTYNMSTDALAEKLRAARLHNTLPKVVIPVHFAGQSCDMATIYALGQEYGFRIIEDASHAIGGQYNQNPIGSCRYSNITVFSFHPVKIITTGEGGMAVTNDPEVADLLSRYRSHGITSQVDQFDPRPVGQIWNYQQIYLGYNYRMTDVLAALGVSQMVRLDAFVKERRRLALNYDLALAHLPIIIPWQSPSSSSSYHLYPIRIANSSKREQRYIYESLLASGVGVNLHYIPVYLQPYYRRLGFGVGYCPESERYFNETLSLPMYASLGQINQDRVIKNLTEILE